ncbi:cysteine proteinase inhibitor [Striga asiatica]|uniref:Cysteine proteinase inhibitor n=1 Tax=Striga asiatica TaxID=4170 RepID=A0A5A7R971_STRAF|nr:cysteine proteinase inhibitor [Striga asiatica]
MIGHRYKMIGACVRQVRRSAAIASGMACRWSPATIGAPPSELARRCTPAAGGDPANPDDSRANAHGGCRAIPWRQVGRSAAITSVVARRWSRATRGAPPGELARRCTAAAGGDPANADDAGATVHCGSRPIPWQRYRVSSLQTSVQSKFSRYQVPSVKSTLHALKFSRSYSTIVPFTKVDEGFAVLNVSYIPSFMYLANWNDPLWNPKSKWPSSNSEFTTHNLYWSRSRKPHTCSVDVESNYMEYVAFRTDLIRWNLDLDELRSFWIDGNLENGDRSNFQHYYCQFCKHGNELTFEPVHYFDNVRGMFRRIEPFLNDIPRDTVLSKSELSTYLPFDSKVKLMRVDCSPLLWVKEISVYHTLDGHLLYKKGVRFGGYDTTSKEWTDYMARTGHNLSEPLIFLPIACVYGPRNFKESDVLPIVNSNESLQEIHNESGNLLPVVNAYETLTESDKESVKGDILLPIVNDVPIVNADETLPIVNADDTLPESDKEARKNDILIPVVNAETLPESDKESDKETEKSEDTNLALRIDQPASLTENNNIEENSVLRSGKEFLVEIEKLFTKSDKSYPLPFISKRYLRAQVERMSSSLASAWGYLDCQNCQSHTGCQRWLQNVDQSFRCRFSRFSDFGPTTPVDADLDFTRLDTKLPTIIVLAKFAVDQYNKENKSNLVYSTLFGAIAFTKAQGTKYELVIFAANNGDLRDYNAGLWFDGNEKRLILFKENE